MNARQLPGYGLAALCAATLLSCSFDPKALDTADSERASAHSVVRNVAAPAPGDLQLVGKVKADEFNDLATGKEVPAQGGQVIVRFNAEPDTLNTWLSTSDAYAQYIAGYIHNSLLRQDPETYEWQGSLAERWIEEDVVVKKDGTKLRGKVSANPAGDSGPVELKTSSGGTIRLARDQVQEVRRGVSFTFFLRRDVRFHDGKPMTATDVKFSFDTIKNEYVDDPSLRTYYNDLESCEVLDKYTVRLTYSKQYWKAIEFAGGFEILPKHIYDPDNLSQKDPKAFGKQFNESPYNRKPIGAGPYKFEKWDTGSQVILTRNDDYWDMVRRGHLDRFVFRFISDPVAALQSLKNGEVDFIPTRINAEQFEEEMNDPALLKRYAKIEYYTGGFCWIGWNMQNPVFEDVRVRQAMAYGAVNLQEFLDRIMYGHGITVTGIQYYFGPAYNHDVRPYPFNPEKAKQLLLEAGWYDRDGDGLRDKNGMPFRFEFLIPSGNDIYRRRAALMKENLRKLGIDMTVRELEWATFIQNITDRKFDACNLCWAGSLESDPYQIWHTSQIGNHGDNFVGFGNAETDRLIEQSRITIDDAERHKIFFEFHRILYETQPYLFLYLQPELGAYDKRYRGVKLYRVRPGYDLTEWFLPKEGSTAVAKR